MDENKKEDCFDTIIRGVNWGAENITKMSYTSPPLYMTQVDVNSPGVNYIMEDISIVLGGELNTNDPYAQLEEYELKKERDEHLRNKHPALREAYEEYQLIKKLVEDNELDDNFEKRYEDFKLK